MNSKTIQKLQYFVDKVCTIMTTSINRSFDENLSREHFVIRIESICSDGIWGIHPYNTSLISFFKLDQVISIHEEVELDPENAQHSEEIDYRR